MADEGFKRKLTTILSADVEGYSRLMGDDEEATVRTLTAYRDVLTTLIQQHNGKVVDSPGDNLLAEFVSVVDAVQCAVAVQKEIKTRNDQLPKNRRMLFRIGINLGDVIQEKGRIYGDGVNIAARLESLANPGGICISKTAFDQIESKLPYGYEFLGDQTVKNIAKPVSAYRVLMEPRVTIAGEPEKEKRSPARRMPILVGAVAIIVLAVALGIWQFYIRRPSVEPASVDKMTFPLPDKPSIAVLPFNNLSGDPEQTYLVDGLTENIIGGLSKIPEMFVIASNSSFTYKGKPVKVQQVAEDLGVRYVLEGSVQRSDEQLRVTAQLIDALNGRHVWSEKYDRKMEDFFSVQDEITLNIAIAMQVKLTQGEQAKVRHATDNLDAWGLAVKAHDLFETYARENIAKARELFKKSVELDPNYAYAWSYLGWTYWIDGVYHSAHYDRKKSFESASKMAEKALGANDKSSDAHALLSAVNLSQQKYDEAEFFGTKTIDLDPNGSENHAIVAITMQNIGKFEEAIALLKQAMRLDPYYPHWYLGRLGMCYQMVDRYEESAAAFEESIKRFRESGSAAPWDRAYLSLAATYSMMDRLEEARDLVSKALEFNPKMTVGSWRKRFQYKDPKHTERILDALRRAGLPD
ncbi:MAG: adenylate/guanylate cyclase domain-containing protein [Nitrospinales bacterium]